MKEIAEQIFRETLAAIDIRATLARKVAREDSIVLAGDARIDLEAFRDIVAIAFGKAAFAMAEGLTDVLSPDFRADGILVVPAAPARKLPGWESFIGGHPTPTSESFRAGRAILDRLARCDDRSLIFFLLSGGGSSMVEQPLDSNITLADFQRLHSGLVTCGAPIEEINVIRKHLSATKGGRLAATAPRSMKVTFAISDVPEGQESALASGPTLPDPSTIRDAEQIAEEYRLAETFDRPVRAIFEEHRLLETPKEGDAAFANAHFLLLLGLHDLFHAAHHACEARGYVCLCDDSTDGWPIEEAADHLLANLETLKLANPGLGVAVLADGEVSSPVTGDGAGGRNSAFVLACVPKIAEKGITVLSAGTDGIDGNSPAAGAVADGETFSRAEAAGLDPCEFMQRSDAYNLFARLGDAVITGPTGNNLRDLRILLAVPEPK
ncbi:MAG: glycerate kinase type-2 family protein [Candidatus Acidiferrales bacterium]